MCPVEELIEAWRAEGPDGGGYSITTGYDLGPEVGEKRAALFDAQQALRDACRCYHARGRDAATALARDEVSLADIAEVLMVSRPEAVRLMAYKPPRSRLIHWPGHGVAHLVREHAVPYLAYAAPAAGSYARVLAADALREYRQRRRTRILRQM